MWINLRHISEAVESGAIQDRTVEWVCAKCGFEGAATDILILGKLSVHTNQMPCDCKADDHPTKDDIHVRVTPFEYDKIMATESGKVQLFRSAYSSSKTYTGGSNSYYIVQVDRPATLQESYQAECDDIIDALGLNFAEGNVLKALWRIAAWRNGWQQKSSPHYDAEKIMWFGRRVLKQNGGNHE